MERPLAKMTAAKNPKKGVPGESLEVFQGLGEKFEEEFAESGLFFFSSSSTLSPLMTFRQDIRGMKNPLFSPGQEDPPVSLKHFAASFLKLAGKSTPSCLQL